MARKKVSNRLKQIGDSEPRGPMPPMPGTRSDAQLVEIGAFISVTVIGTLILVGMAVFFGLKAIENHLESESLRAVDAVVFAAAEEDPSFRNITDISAEASGLNVHLRGTVDNEEMIETIPALVGTINGIGTVTAELEWVPPLNAEQPAVTTIPITLTWSGNSATIVGEVSDESSRTAV
ncbi:MAG: BON domain-containing protein, partial [Acidimicrobiia bacterium]|nr:BON domain-containing protein [Acidimicrobiia bacterium]